ncbi:MAG TPA: WD40 repeat domain-containing protein [Bryobacteraceae bacterium]|nr:WD40 repeat domain-containing protein [Bryobacteraceae bacterium]
MQSSRILTVLLCVLAPLLAVETRTWEQSEQADFERGTLTKLSLSSDGRLMPAPVVKEIFDASVTFLWTVARDSKGNVYAGGGGVGGSKAKLVQIDPGGNAKTLAELDGLAIQAVAIDRQDRVYAATSPDGKVYRVDAASGKADVFYDPKTKYIWALAFAQNGDLFVATGDQGEIHRVTPAGAGSVFYKTEEAHARSLALDGNDNLIAGTEPSGLILRISPAGQGFVLYEAPKREVTAVAIASNGMIYASATGNKQPATAPAVPAAGRGGGGATPNPAPAVGAAAPAGRAGAGAPPAVANPAAGVPGGSEVYRIQSDGYARKVWNHAQDVVYALAFDAQGRVVIGTGNRGMVYRIDGDRSYTRLTNLAPAQVTAFCAAPGGKIYAATGNIGEVFSIGPENEASGTLESDVFDASGFSDWGRLTSLTKGQGNVTFETRSGNVSRAQKDWSPWMRLSGDRIASPAARFLQYRATVTGAAELYDVSTAYETRNIAPVVEEIEITPPNYKFPAPSGAPAASTTLNLPALGKKPPPATASSGDAGSTPALTFAKGQIGARWLATDDNGDTLAFKLEIRGDSETAWKLLKDGIRERYFSWDSTAFPDGKYYLRVTASDAPSNAPEQALSASRESDRFLIDNSAPEITGLTGAVNGARIDVRFHAKDAWNVLEKAEYSVNGGDWKVVEPTTRIADSEEHDYRFQVDRGQGEVTIAVRVKDAYANEAAAKTVVK